MSRGKFSRIDSLPSITESSPLITVQAKYQTLQLEITLKINVSTRVTEINFIFLS
jgi:hypothetical protein